MPEYVFKNGFKVLVPEDLSQKTMIEEWASVAMYMAIMLHPPATMKKGRKSYTWKTKEKNKNKNKKQTIGWKAPKKLEQQPQPQPQPEQQP